MTSIWFWTLQGQRYPIYLQISKPKLLDESFQTFPEFSSQWFAQNYIWDFSNFEKLKILMIFFVCVTWGPVGAKLSKCYSYKSLQSSFSSLLSIFLLCQVFVYFFFSAKHFPSLPVFLVCRAFFFSRGVFSSALIFLLWRAFFFSAKYTLLCRAFSVSIK